MWFKRIFACVFAHHKCHIFVCTYTLAYRYVYVCMHKCVHMYKGKWKMHAEYQKKSKTKQQQKTPAFLGRKKRGKTTLQKKTNCFHACLNIYIYMYSWQWESEKCHNTFFIYKCHRQYQAYCSHQSFHCGARNVCHNVDWYCYYNHHKPWLGSTLLSGCPRRLMGQTTA